MNKKIIIYSIPRKSVLGLSDWTSDVSGKSLQKTKFGMSTDNIAPLYSSKIGGLNTGLHEPWIENGVQVKDKEGNLLTLQDKYEKQYNKPKGFLTNAAGAQDGNIADEKEQTYFQNLTVRLNDGSTVLDLNDFDDLMKYHVCLASKYVANSEKEWRSHKWPHAKFYIAVENEAEEIKYKKNYIKSKAFSNLHDSNMTFENKKKIAAILELVSSRSVVSNETVDNMLYEYIDKSEFDYGSNIDKFNELYHMLATTKGKIELEARYLLKQAMDCRLVYEKQGTYTWIKPTGSLVIGERYSEAIDFLTNPKKETLIEELKNQIKAKTI